MAGQRTNQGTRHTFLAGAAINANEAVKFSAHASGRVTVVKTTAITEDVIGWATETVANAEDCVVECGNGVIVKGIASAAITAGAQVMPGANGKVATAAGATAKSCGICLNAPANDGEVAEILTRLGVNGPANT